MKSNEVKEMKISGCMVNIICLSPILVPSQYETSRDFNYLLDNWILFDKFFIWWPDGMMDGMAKEKSGED